MTGKSYAPTEMIIRGLPGWLAGGWGNPIPPGKYWRPAFAAAGFDIHPPPHPDPPLPRVAHPLLMGGRGISRFSIQGLAENKFPFYYLSVHNVNSKY